MFPLSASEKLFRQVVCRTQASCFHRWPCTRGSKAAACAAGALSERCESLKAAASVSGLFRAPLTQLKRFRSSQVNPATPGRTLPVSSAPPKDRAPPKDQEGALSCAKAQIRARRSRQIPSRRRTPLAARARCRRAHMLLLLAPMSAVAAMSWVLIGELDDLVVGCNHYTASKPRSGGVGEFATLALALLPLLPPTGNPAASVLKHARH